MDDLVSVILPVYNESEEYIKESVESILNQSYRNLEIIIIVDNPDNNRIIRQVKDYARRDNRVRVLVNERNLGLALSLNRAIGASKGQIVARMDADDISEENRIAEQIVYLNSNDLDIVGSNIINIDDEGKVLSKPTVYPETDGEIQIATKYHSPIPHPTWMVRHSVYLKMNGYRNITACEDYDFLVRAILQRFRLGVLQKPLLKYRINPNSISNTNKIIQKQTFYFISRDYKRGKESDINELESYRKSLSGRHKEESLAKYYKMTNKYKNIHNSLFKALYGIFIVMVSTQAKINISNYVNKWFDMLLYHIGQQS